MDTPSNDDAISSSIADATKPTELVGSLLPSFMETELIGGKQPSRLELGSPPPGGRPPTETVHLHRGEIWGGDFELGPLIGKGGMGAVYAGRQLSLERAVAIKALRVHLSEDPELIARFEQEAKWLARINSPHVIQVHAFGKHRNHHFLVMELIEGEDVGRKIKSGWRPSHAETVNLVAQAAQGLMAAAEHGIVHRDIKPGNMLLTLKGVLKVTDFGLARLVHASSNISSTGVILGTDAYMSPEQCQGLAVDPRSDIYSLGVVFYELLTGQRPFAGETHMEVFLQHIDRTPAPPRSLDSTIPPEVEAVVLTCLAKDPAHRYQSAGDLFLDLERVAAHQWPMVSLRLPHPSRQLRLRVIASAMVVVLAACLAWFTLFRPQHSAASSLPARSAGAGTATSASPAVPGANLSSSAHGPSAGQSSPQPPPGAANGEGAAPSPESVAHRLAVVQAQAADWCMRAKHPQPAASFRHELLNLLAESEQVGGNRPWQQQLRSSLAGMADTEQAPTPHWAASHDHDAYGAWAECSHGSYQQRFYWCPPGSFTQGQGPGRLVTISQGYWMASQEVTLRQWAQLMGEHGRSDHPDSDGGDLPVTGVTWDQAQDFCRSLSSTCSCQASLPTEAQWEYACRSGRSWSADELADVAWTKANTSGLHGVSQRKPSPWGLCDCFGNALEWCSDWYAPYAAGAQRDPAGPADGEEHVARGGDILQLPEACLPSARFHFEPQTTLETLGFRILIRQ